MFNVKKTKNCPYKVQSLKKEKNYHNVTFADEVPQMSCISQKQQQQCPQITITCFVSSLLDQIENCAYQ